MSGHELTFVDPKGPQNLRVRFRAVMSAEHELAGSADATLEHPDSPVRLLGTWRLRKK